MTAEFASFEDRAWAETIREDEMGIICNTNTGTAPKASRER